MLFYCVFLFLVGLCLSAYHKTNLSIYNKLLICIITLTAICRYNVGYDYGTYYNLIVNESHELIWLLFSPLSALIAEIAIYYHSPQLLFIIFGIPTYILIFSTFKKYSSRYALSVLMFLSLDYFGTLSTIRQALAVAITFYAFRYVKEKKILKYSLFIALASLFHTSAIIAIIIYWLPRLQFNKLIIGCIVGYMLKAVAFDSMQKFGIYDNYLTEDSHIEGGKFTQLIIYGIYAFCVYTWVKQNKRCSRDYVNIITVGIMMYLIFGPHLGARVGLYFIVFIYLLLPNLIDRLSVRSRNLWTAIWSYIFILYFILYLCMPFIKGNNSFYIPYKVFFLS